MEIICLIFKAQIFKALQHYVMRLSSMTALNPIECKSIHALNNKT